MTISSCAKSGPVERPWRKRLEVHSCTEPTDKMHHFLNHARQEMRAIIVFCISAQALRADLNTSSQAGLREAEELRERLLGVEREAAASSAANAQTHEREKAEIRDEHENKMGELRRTIEQQEEMLQTLRRQQKEGGERSTEAAAKEEELTRMREEVSLKERHVDCKRVVAIFADFLSVES